LKAGAMASPGSAGLRLEPVMLADSVFSRTRGLLFRPCPALGAGMLIPRCNSIHTVGMGYAIDVIFLDPDSVVVRIVHDLKPWRMRLCRRASSVLELGGGHARRLGVQEGQQLQWIS